MADQIYSMCWPAAAQSSQYQSEAELHKHNQRYGRAITSGCSSKHDSSNEEFASVPVGSHSSKDGCKTPGYCINGKPVSLSHLAQHGLAVDVPPGMVLAGAKSPLLGKMILVAAVDKRFLPSDHASPTTLGFSGCCVGCGDPHFRYFTEFATHVNLLLATQPKKQKHLKCYIMTDNLGRLCRGPRIPWRDTPRKRAFPYPTYQSMLENNTSQLKVSDVSSTSFTVPAMIGGNHVIREGRSSTSSQSSADSGSTFDAAVTPPLFKRSRDDAEKDVAVDIFPSHAWLESVCGVKPVLISGHPNTLPHFVSSYKEIILSDMLHDCFEFLSRSTSSNRQFLNTSLPSSSQSSHPSRGSFFHSGELRSDGPTTSGFTLPQLSANVVIILMAQYLSTLPENCTICNDEVHHLLRNSKELFWQTHQENSTIQPFFLTIDSTNLIHFVSVATLPSKGSVKLVSSVLSLNDAISKGLGFLYQISKHNRRRETKLQVPLYLLLVSSPPAQSPEFCILVTGVNQSKLIQERTIKDHSSAATSLQLEKCICSLDEIYDMVNAAIGNLMKQLEESMKTTKLVFLPYNGSSILKAKEKEAACMVPKMTLGTSFQAPVFELLAPQVAAAHHLLSRVLSSKNGVTPFDLRHFSSVEFTIVIPPSQSYFHQLLLQVQRSNILLELGLSPPTQSKDAGLSAEHIVQNNGSEETKQRMKDFLCNARTCQDVLFVLVCDEAHRYFTPEIASTLPSFQELSRLPNTLIVLVTSVPYLFETCQSRIRAHNEVFWNDFGHLSGPIPASDQKLLKKNANLVHFGIREYMESLSWTHQIPLIREDDEFEGMVSRVNLLTSASSNIVRCYVLIHHYTTAIMWSAGMRSIEPHCTFKTLQIVRDIIECPLLSSVGRGAMLLIRIPSALLASWAYRKLVDIRDRNFGSFVSERKFPKLSDVCWALRVGFQFRFAVILDDGECPLQIEPHFLQRIRAWRNGHASMSEITANGDWHPTCYEDLLDLPCIVVVSGKERNEDTFPRSLKYCDFRLLDEQCFYRSTLELEFNAVSRYINSALRTSSQDNSQRGSGDHSEEAKMTEAECDRRNQFCSSYPLPVILVSRMAYSALKKDFFGCPKNLSLSPDPGTDWNSDQRPALVSDLPAEQSKYYRRWTKPRANFSPIGKDNTFLDSSQIKFHPSCFLFSGAPQVGKIPAILHFIQLLYSTLLKLQRVDVCDDAPDFLILRDEVSGYEMDKPMYKVLSKVPFNASLVGARFSCVSRVHQEDEKSKMKKAKFGNDEKDSMNDVASKHVPVSSVMMSSFAAYDSYHHCDDCMAYREGLGPNLFSKHVVSLRSGEELIVIVPSARREWFSFNARNELQTLKLPVVCRKSSSESWKAGGRHGECVISTPVLVPSVGRCKEGLLNLYHAMEGQNFVHLTFVKNNELALYQNTWPNHVFVALPPSCDHSGLGMMKDIIKEFMIENLSAERQRQRCENSTNIVWPFIHIMEDSCVMWQHLSVDNSNSCQEDDHGKAGNWSLFQTFLLVESSPNVTSFALIGFNQWGTGNEIKYKLNSYSVCHVYSSVFLNIDLTHNVTYNRRLFTWEEVDFNLNLSAHSGVILRYNHVNVLTKRILGGGGRTYDITNNIDDIISLPDRDPAHVIPAPAHFLLEEYLRIKAAEKIFPAANENAANPVLLLDCFLNLGPGLAVEYFSTSSLESMGSGARHYGGLLLYLCNGCSVTKESLRGFQFCPGATICVISSDRSTLRDHVVKLDLEEHWRFRLRDEFKTAGSLNDGPLYFLTGTYDG